LYEHTVQWQHHELHRKNYEINQLKERLCAYHDELTKVRKGQPRSAFDVLLLLANDPNQPPNVRLRAAEAIVQFERPKLSATVNTNRNVSIGARLDLAAHRHLEAERAAIAPDRPIWSDTVIEGGPDAA